MPLLAIARGVAGLTRLGDPTEQCEFVRAIRTPHWAVLQFPAGVTGADWVCLRTMSMAISIDCS